MRNQQSIDLGDSGIATVRELRVRDVRLILTQLQDADWRQADLAALARERLPDLLALAGDSLTLPEGLALDDLTLSECEAIGRAWWELHQRFFAPLLAYAKEHARVPPSAPPTSTVLA